MQEILNQLWVEKYTPKSIDNMILSEEYRLKFQSYLNNKEIPHLMLVGPPGCGKTTISKILCNDVLGDEDDSMCFNGSRETGVDNIRNNIQLFLSTPAINSKIKIVYIDEADYLSQNAQALLRGIMEQYQETSRFVFTLNYVHKIIDPLKSRFQVFEFNQLPKDHIQDHISNILKTEKIEFEDKDLDQIIDRFYPDVRKIIGVVQSLSIDGTLQTKSSSINNSEQIILEKYKSILNYISVSNNIGINKELKDIEKTLSNDRVDFFSLYAKMFDIEAPFYCRLHIGESIDSLSIAVVPHIHFLTTLFKIVKSGLLAKSKKFYE